MKSRITHSRYQSFVKPYRHASRLGNRYLLTQSYARKELQIERGAISKARGKETTESRATALHGRARKIRNIIPISRQLHRLFRSIESHFYTIDTFPPRQFLTRLWASRATATSIWINPASKPRALILRLTIVSYSDDVMYLRDVGKVPWPSMLSSP